MAESKDETAEVLSLLQTSDEPSAADKARVRAAVWARVGLAGAVTAAAATGVHSLGQAGGAAATAGSNALSGLGANALGSGAASGGALGGALATGSALGLKAAWVVTVAKVGLAVALLGAGAWYGARSVAPVSAPAMSNVVSASNDVNSKPEYRTWARLVEPKAPVMLGAQTPSDALAPSKVRSSNSDTLDAEMALLGDAQRALSAGQYASALASLDKHAARFPRGALASERQASRAIALCRSGALVAGRKLATRYVTAHSGSPLVTRVRTACQLSE